MHYYPHHIGDFIKETANLNDHQLATYLRMIWAYYLDENPLPDDCERIAFAVRSDEKTVRVLLKHYFELIDGKWHQKRCDKEIEHYKLNSEKGRKAAEARWQKHSQNQSTKSERNADAMHTHTKTDAFASLSDANQEPRTKNQEPIIKINPPNPPRGDDEVFEKFWALYPKKVGKQAALKAWKKIPSPKQTLTLIENALAWQTVSEQWTKDNGQYIPNPQTYINQGRWQDQQIAPVGNQSLTKLGQRAEMAASRWLNNVDGELL